MKTKITEMLGIEYPIIQGGMAWVAEHHLAAAVSEAGGLGLIGGANAPGEVVREEIRKARELTKKPFGVNVMLMSPYADDVAKVVVEEGIKVVTTGAGIPGKYMGMWKEAGIKVIPVVASVAQARLMEKSGADAVVAEGMESGGHIGEATTMTLVPQVVDAVSIPVIAAGGIADGRGIAAAFMLGAEAVQMGTRFVVSKESIVSQAYKDRVIKAKDIDSTVTGMSHGHPIRCLRNKMTREYLKLEKEGRPFEELEYLTLGTLRKAVMEGDVDNGTVMAGQIAGMVKKEQTCKEMIEEMMAQAEAVKSSGGVKVLGSGCAKCNALEEAAREALAELGMDTAIDHVTDFTQIAAYGVMTTPALVVDGKVVSYGKVLKKDEAKALIQKVRG